MDLGLNGLNVLITGGTKGIGRQCAEIFAAEGANITVSAMNFDAFEASLFCPLYSADKVFNQLLCLGPLRQCRHALKGTQVTGL